MLNGGYRKKYRRTLSRLVALAREGAQLTGAGRLEAEPGPPPS